jgi:hypothetical protein
MGVLEAVTRRKPAASPPARARREPRPAKRKPPKPVDALGAIAGLARVEKQYHALATPVRTTTDIEPDGGMLDGGRITAESPDVSMLRPTQLLTTGGRDAVRGPEAVLAWFAKQGITITLTADGRLLATSPGGGILASTREALRVTAPLIRAHLAGAPLRCGLQHRLKNGEAVPLAVTLAEPDGVPLCADHATGILS